MITNKDIRVENGSLIINGDKYPLDGQSPEAIMEIVKDNSDTTPTENSDDPITSGGVFNALGTKQDTLNFDNVPTSNSDNPVKSNGIKTYVDGKIFVKVQSLGTSLLVNANSFGRAQIPCYESGYTAIGVISVQGAAYAGAVSIMDFGLESDEKKAYVYIANNTSTNLTLPDVKVRVLYTKN